MGPGDGAVPGAGCGKAVDIAVWNVNVKKVLHKLGLPSRSLGVSDAKRPHSGVAARKAFGAGADDGIRTRDLRFTKPLLYQLSYIGGGSEAAKMAPVESMSKKEGDGLREGDLVVWRSKLSEGCRGLRFQS